MKINDVLKKIPANLKKEAAIFATKIRELEEISTGHFVCFVDDGELSQDISIRLSKKLELNKYSCDCTSTTKFCPHIIAVFQKIDSGNIGQTSKLTIKKLSKKKISKSEELLYDLSEKEIKDWVHQQLAKDKKLEILFLDHFSKKDDVFTIFELQQFIKDSKKAVLGRKRKFNSTQLQELLKIWEQTYTKYFDQIARNLQDAENLVLFSEMVNALTQLHYQLDKSTTRIKTFLKKQIKEFAKKACNISPDNFVKCLTSNIDRINENTPVFTSIILEVSLEFLSDQHKNILLQSYIPLLSHYDSSESLRLKYLDWVTKINPQADLLQQLPLALYNNEYNLRLLDLLLEKEQFELVESYCITIINSNYYYHYNIPYQEILLEVYQKTGNREKLLELLNQQFGAQPNFENFIDIYNLLESDEERDAVIKSAKAIKLSKNKNNFLDVLTLKFGIMDMEGNYEEMLLQMKDIYRVHYMVPYVDKLIQTNKVQYFKNLISIPTFWDYEFEMWYRDFIEQIVLDYFDDVDKNTLLFYVSKSKVNPIAKKVILGLF